MTEVGFFQHSGVQLSDVPGPYLDGQSPVESETRTDPTACTAKDLCTATTCNVLALLFYTSQRIGDRENAVRACRYQVLAFLSHVHIDIIWAIILVSVGARTKPWTWLITKPFRVARTVRSSVWFKLHIYHHMRLV